MSRVGPSFMPESLYLITYGTLRRTTDGLERLGVADRVSFVDACRFNGVLYDLGRFPGAVPGDWSARVRTDDEP